MKSLKPKVINPFALECLNTLQDTGLGKFIALGGAFGLAHFHEYRTTKDIDAWWSEDAGEGDQQEVIALLERTLARHGLVSIRRFGDVVSIDLKKEGKVIFNFQIARRSALLRKPLKSPWDPVKVDSFDDLIASKMTALFERGAPRDFLDIYQMCTHTLLTISQCWHLWQERENKRGISPDIALAGEALSLHLSRIEKTRPLESIGDSEEREHARKLRMWYKNEFCKIK